jgi:hypothetical protein
MAASNCIIEACIATQATVRGLQVETIDPKHVSNYFELIKGKNKKKHAVSKVIDLISNEEIKVPEQLQAMFRACHKKYDLADSLLQAIFVAKSQE